MTPQYLGRILRGSQATTVAAARTTTPTADVMALIDALAACPEEPCRAYMQSRGCSPDDGWLLVLPANPEFLAITWGPLGPPDYVRQSNALTAPVLMRGFASPGALR